MNFKDKQREELAADLEKWIREGGIIEVLPVTQRTGYLDRFNPFFDPDSED